MKSKFAIIVLAIFLSALLLFNSCVDNTPTQESSAETTIETDEETNDQTSQTVSDETSIEESIEESEDVRFNEETDIEGLYRLNYDFFEGYDTFLFDVDESAGIIRYELIRSGLDSSDIKVVNYSVKDNAVVGSIDFEDTDVTIVSMENGGFATLALYGDTIDYYDKTATKTESHKAPYDPSAPINTALSSNGRTMLFTDSENEALYCHNFDTGETKTVYENLSSMGYLLSNSDGYFFCDNDDSLVFYDPESNQITTVTEYGNFSIQNSIYGINYGEKRIVLTEVSPNGDMLEINEPKGKYSVYSTNEYIITEDSDQYSTLYVYDLTSKTVFSQELNGFLVQAAISNDAVYAICNVGERLEQYVFPLREGASADIETTDVPYKQSEDIEKPEVIGNADIVELTNKLIEEYNVRVVFQAEAVDEHFGFMGATYQVITGDEESVYDAVLEKLKATESYLQSLPEGMVGEVLPKSADELWLALATDIKTEILADGVTNGNYIMVDVSLQEEIFQQTLAHEFMHIIDAKLGDEWDTAWTLLMPEDIREDAYYLDYNPTYDFKYTQFDNGNTEVWFYDDYARTYIGEDYARIFEHLYISTQIGDLDDGLDFENLRMKARFMCVMLRNEIECCKTAETLPWEQYLGEIDMHEFDGALIEANIID